MLIPPHNGTGTRSFKIFKIFILTPGPHTRSDDAQRKKHNELVLFLMETSGALSPPARRHLRWLHRRSKGIDRTPYDSLATRGGGGKPFVQYWTQRLSAAVVAGDARRALNAISACAVRSSF